MTKKFPKTFYGLEERIVRDERSIIPNRAITQGTPIDHSDEEQEQ